LLSRFFYSISLIWAITTSVLLVALSSIGTTGYGVVKLFTWYPDVGYTARSDGDPIGSEFADANPGKRTNRLDYRYANGRLSQTEAERQLEHKLGSSNIDTIDRELTH